MCGERLERKKGTLCPICLELQDQRKRRRMPPRRRVIAVVLLPILFAGSCTALLPIGIAIAEPMTHRPVDTAHRVPFPVVIMTAGDPRVHSVPDVRHMPILPAGSSYLIPPGKDEVVEDALGGWVLTVDRVAPGRQHIDLYWMDDGFRGGGYEATASSVVPRYRKVTGPGFALVFGGIALAMNLILWFAVIRGVRKNASHRVSPFS